MSSYQIVGIDVAARSLVASGEEGLLRPAYENTPAGRGALIQTLRRSKQPVRVVLEATGIYFLDVACELVAAGIEVMVINPKAAHHFAAARLQRRKNDPVDAAMLRAFGSCMPFVPWTPPRSDLFAFRALAREAQAQIKAAAAAKNRLHALGATKLAPANVVQLLKQHIADAEAIIAALVAAARQQIEADPELKRLFEHTDSMPGFAAKGAIFVMAELLVLPPMTARQWVAQAGLDVREDRSGTSVQHKPRLSKRGNKRLREALFYPALTATRCCPEIRAFVERLLARGKTKLQAIAAVMRKLLHGLHAMWLKHEDFNAKKLFAQA